MSALPPKADIGTQSWNVRFVPKADMYLFAERECRILARVRDLKYGDSLVVIVCCLFDC
jgi:hypothetical protein